MNEYLSQAKENIRNYRKKPLKVIVTRDGAPVPGCQVHVKQKKHEFLFGANCFKVGDYGSQELNEQYERLFLGLFNYATLPYYWGMYEKERGVTQEKRLMELNDWCDRHGLERKGHPLHWHEGPPSWLGEPAMEELDEMVKKRVGDVIRVFKTRVKMWDIVNEITRAKGFKDVISRYEVWRGEHNVVDMLARLVMDIDPEARLLLNECNLRKEDFSLLLRKLQDMGTPLYGIGLQSHMHEGTNSLEHLWKQNERYGAFGLPLHYTELSILSGRCGGTVDWYSKDGNQWIIEAGDEERQAHETEEIYTLLFGHPAVEAITWWDIVDGYWLKAPSGLLRHDTHEPKPAYRVLEELIRHRWWTDECGVTGADGAFTADAFFGEHSVSIVCEGKPLMFNTHHSKHVTGEALLMVAL